MLLLLRLLLLRLRRLLLMCRALEALVRHRGTDLSKLGDVPGGPQRTSPAIEAVRLALQPKGRQALNVFLAAAVGDRALDLNYVNGAGECCASVAMEKLNARTQDKLQLLELLMDQRQVGDSMLDLSGVDLRSTLVECVRFKDKGATYIEKLVGLGLANPNHPGRRPLDAALRQPHRSSVKMVERNTR